MTRYEKSGSAHSLVNGYVLATAGTRFVEQNGRRRVVDYPQPKHSQFAHFALPLKELLTTFFTHLGPSCHLELIKRFPLQPLDNKSAVFSLPGK